MGREQWVHTKAGRMAGRWPLGRSKGRVFYERSSAEKRREDRATLSNMSVGRDAPEYELARIETWSLASERRCRLSPQSLLVTGI